MVTSLRTHILSVLLVILLVLPVFSADFVLFDQSRRDLHFTAGFGVGTVARQLGCSKDESILIGFLAGAAWEQYHYQYGADYDVIDVLFNYLGAVASQAVHEWMVDHL